MGLYYEYRLIFELDQLTSIVEKTMYIIINNKNVQQIPLLLPILFLIFIF